MRKLVLLVVLVLSITSCLDNTNPQFSPEIYTSYFYVNPVFVGDSLVSAKDTLDLRYYSEDGSYEMDTIYVGDTVMFASAFSSVANNLVAVKLDWDSTRMHLWFPLTEDVVKVLTNQSDTLAGRLYFKPGYNRVSFPVYFSPLDRGGMNLKLTVESDSEFSSSSVLFYVPVKPSKEDNVSSK